MQKTPNDIVIFLIVVSALIVGMVLFIIMMLYLYSKKQAQFKKGIEQIKLDHEKTILSTQLEIQEQTFQNISREIHDNISLSLTLAKLQLHTINWSNKEKSAEHVDSSIGLITKSIAELSDISKSLNADIIIQHGLLQAIEEELNRIRQAGLFTLEYDVTGTPLYMDNQKELIIFRIVQEAFNNIIKHAAAATAQLMVHYNSEKLIITIRDDGKGFNTEAQGVNRQAGLKNMETRIKILKGTMDISSQPGNGTVLSFTIPFE
jgi:two-component system, NarL family, sensor kinase